MLRILGKPTSINVRKVLWLCEELALPFALEPWGSGYRDTHTPEFMARNPNAMVPVLVESAGDDRPERVLWESNTICRYLAGRQGRHDLLPADPAARAQVEQWMDWQATELNNAWRYAFMGRVRRSPAHQDAKALSAGIETWHHHMRILDGQLAQTGSWVTGDAFTLADIVLGLSVNRWLLTPMQRPALAHVTRFEEGLRERPGYRLHGRNGHA